MTDKDAQEFDNSYQRAKRVLRRLNDISRQEYLKILKTEESVKSIEHRNFGEYQAYMCGQRNVWNKIQELTRTK